MINEQDFGWAISALKADLQVARESWRERNMYLELQVPDSNSKMGLPYIFKRNPDGRLCPWIPTNQALLANDWYDVNA